MIPELRGVDADGARTMVAAVRADAVRAEIMQEDDERERRLAARENRGGSGHRQHCGGCYWVLQKTSQPCLRCGYTKGYGYSR